MNQKNQNSALLSFLETGKSWNLVTIFEKTGKEELVISQKYLLEEMDQNFSYTPVLKQEEGQYRFFEPVSYMPRLLLFGGGHIAKTLCAFAAKTGFAVWVIDEREEFANKERFPDARQVICAPFLLALEQVSIHEEDYVAIITRGHACDGDCLSYILTHTIPRYLGMIGSRSRVRAQFASFEKQGIEKEKLEMVHNPIGLKIGAVTPEEIAVSILAELIAEKRMAKKGKEKEQYPIIETDLEWEVLQRAFLSRQPFVTATILSSSGSTPRKAGAKMLVFGDGTIVGTIGGGFGENEVIKKARSLINTKKAILFHVSMDADVAMREGMACGGEMDVLIEDGPFSLN